MRWKMGPNAEISEWKAAKVEHNIHCRSMDSQKSSDVIREEPFDKEPSKIQSTTQKPPKKLAVEERQSLENFQISRQSTRSSGADDLQ